MTASGTLAALLVVAQEEPSKVPFYVGGGVLALWAVVASAFGILRKGSMTPFEGTVMMAVTTLLVLGAIGTAIGTSGEGEAEGQQEASPEEGGPVEDSPPAEASGEAPEGGGAGALRLAADPGGQLRFDKDALRARAGRVTIALANESPLPHNVAIEREGREIAKSPTVTGRPTEVTARLRPGRYTFFCDVSGHREGGMEGTLTVR